MNTETYEEVPSLKSARTLVEILVALVGALILTIYLNQSKIRVFLNFDTYKNPFQMVRLLSEKEDNEARIESIEAVLDDMDLDVRRGSSINIDDDARNLWVDIGEKGPLYYFVAHPDKFNSPGANDNASGVAVLIAALSKLKANPPTSIRLRFFFADNEELGLKGSKHHLRILNHKTTISGVFNFDMVGAGDKFYYSSGSNQREVTNPPAQGSPVATVKAVLGKLQIPSEQLPWGFSDHRAFADKSIPAVGLIMGHIRDDEKHKAYIGLRFKLESLGDKLRNMDRGSEEFKSGAKKYKSDVKKFKNMPLPENFQTIHTKDDTIDKIEPETLDLTVSIVMEIINTLEAAENWPNIVATRNLSF